MVNTMASCSTENESSQALRLNRDAADAGYLSQVGRLNVREPRGQQAGHEASGITIRNPVTQTRHGFLQITQSLEAEPGPSVMDSHQDM